MGFLSVQERIREGYFRKKEGNSVHSASEAVFHFFRESLGDVRTPEEIAGVFGELFLTNYTGAQNLPLWIYFSSKDEEKEVKCKSGSLRHPLTHSTTSLLPAGTELPLRLSSLPHSFCDCDISITTFRLVISLLSTFSDNKNHDLSSSGTERQEEKSQRQENDQKRFTGTEFAVLCGERKSTKAENENNTLSIMVPSSTVPEKSLGTFNIEIDVERVYFSVLKPLSLTSRTTLSPLNNKENEVSPFFCTESVLGGVVHQQISQMRRREADFLFQLAKFFREIIFLLENDRKADQREEHASGRSALSLAFGSPIHITVPLYQIRCEASDAADTRLSALVPNVLENMIDSVITAEHSICQLGTVVLQWMFYVAKNVLPFSLQAAKVLLDLLESEERNIRIFDTSLFIRSDIIRFLLLLLSPSPPTSLKSTCMEHVKIQKMFPLPSAVVHCLQGVSRSPSVVLCYVIRKWAHFFKKGIRHRKERGKKVFSDYLTSTEEEGVQAAGKNTFQCEDSSTEMDERYLFQNLIASFRKFRPMVHPNPCFSAELHSMWRSLVLQYEK